MSRARLAASGLAFAAPLFVGLGCDPVVSVHATVTVSPEAIAAYSGAFPAQVLVTDDHDAYMSGGPHAHRIAVLCQKSDAAQRFRYDRDGVGCANETHLVAYVAPLAPSEAGATCGALAEAKRVEAPPPPGKPWGRATVFAGMKGECSNHDASASIAISAGP